MCDLESSVVLSNVALNANLSDTSGSILSGLPWTRIRSDRSCVGSLPEDQLRHVVAAQRLAVMPTLWTTPKQPLSLRFQGPQHYQKHVGSCPPPFPQ